MEPKRNLMKTIHYSCCACLSVHIIACPHSPKKKSKSVSSVWKHNIDNQLLHYKSQVYVKLPGLRSPRIIGQISICRTNFLLESPFNHHLHQRKWCSCQTKHNYVCQSVRTLSKTFFRFRMQISRWWLSLLKCIRNDRARQRGMWT